MKRHLNDTPAPIKVDTEWRFGVVAARFNGDIVTALIEGATRCLAEYRIGHKNIDIWRVPGCFEIPLMAQRAVDHQRYSAVIALGAIIRGETPHFDYIATESARGIAEIARTSRIPITFGVLTTNTPEQAWHRAGSGEENNGWQAARAALETLSEIRRLEHAVSAQRTTTPPHGQ